MESLATGQPPKPMDWKWRTFPVYFALALGLFAGFYIGMLSEFARQEGNSTPNLVATLVIALMLGLGLSRLTTKWLVTRRIVKPRPQRR